MNNVTIYMLIYILLYKVNANLMPMTIDKVFSLFTGVAEGDSFSTLFIHS